MSVKPENTFIAGVHRQFVKVGREPHHEKMCNPYSSGTWDVWYSGKKQGRKPTKDLWIEYKWMPKIPVRETTLITPELSVLQLKWGEDRYEEGRNVAVIVGCPDGGVLFTDMAWEETLAPSLFRSMLKTRLELAEYIANLTMPL